MIIVASASDLVSAVNAVASAEPSNPYVQPAGEEILILPGSYTFTSPIYLPWGLTLRGSGPFTTYLSFTAGDAFVFYTPGANSAGISGVVVSSMNITTAAGGRGFSVNYPGSGGTYPPLFDLGPIVLSDLNMTCAGIAIDLDPAGARPPQPSPVPFNIVSLSQVMGTATATIQNARTFSTGDTVTVSGASPGGYNGSFTITAVNATQFTYSVSSGLSTPATGAITGVFNPLPVMVSPLSQTLGVATAVTATAHGFATGYPITIAGASPTGYNGIFPIVVTDATHFTYSVSSSLGSASGSITATYSPSPISVTSLTQASGTASATTASAHGYADGDPVLIAGATATPSNESYNGIFAVHVTGTNTFEYSVSSSLSTPAGGTITVAFNPVGVYSQQVVLDNINFATCNTGLITINGNENVLRRCQVANNAGTPYVEPADGLVRVTGAQNLLEAMIVGIFQEVPACYYVANTLNTDGSINLGSAQFINCWAEGGLLDRGIHAVNAQLTLDQLVFSPQENANFIAAIDAQNSSINMEMVNLVSVDSLIPQGGFSAFFNLDSASNVTIQKALAARDVGNINNPQIAIQQAVSTGIPGYSPYTLNYPPAVRGSNLLAPLDTLTNWTNSLTGGITITASGVKTSADGKAMQYFFTVGTVSGVVTVTSLVQSNGTATATTSSPHLFSATEQIRIVGSTSPGYNGLQVVQTVPDSIHFTFDVPSNAPSTASGSITAYPSTGIVTVTASASSPSLPITSTQYTLQYNIGTVIGDESSLVWYNNQTLELPNRCTNTLTAAKFSPGTMTFVSNINFQVANVFQGTYTITDAGLWTTY